MEKTNKIKALEPLQQRRVCVMKLSGGAAYSQSNLFK